MTQLPISQYKALVESGTEPAVALEHVLHPYDLTLEEVEDILLVTNKTLAVAQQEQCTWPGFYDSRKVEASALSKYLQMRAEATRGVLTRQYVENYSRELGERVIARYIDGDPKYIAAMELVFRAQTTADKYDVVSNAFTKRGYALRDLTTAYVEKINEVI